MSKQAKIEQVKNLLKPKAQQYCSIILNGKIIKTIPAKHAGNIHVQNEQTADEIEKLIAGQ